MNCKCCGAWFSSSDTSQELCAACRRALERVSPIIESLAAELEQVKQERDGLNILLGQAQSMLETRTRERDAAVKDVKSLCTKGCFARGVEHEGGMSEHESDC